MKRVNQGLPVMDSLSLANVDHCFLTQFWFLCQSFTNNSYSLQEAHLYLLLSWSFDWFSWMVCVCSSHSVGCQEGVSFVSSCRQRRDKPPCWQADLHKILNRLSSLLLGVVHPFSGDLRFGEDKIHCCSSVPSIRKKLSGQAKEKHEFGILEKWSWIPVCHFFPLGRHWCIILCPDYNRLLK